MKILFVITLLVFLLASCSNASIYHGLWSLEREDTISKCEKGLGIDKERESASKFSFGEFLKKTITDTLVNLACDKIVDMLPISDIKDD